MKTARNIIEWITILALIFFLSMIWINNSHGASFPEYQHVELSDLANHSDKWNSEEVQIRGKINRISEYTGRYSGTYIGLSMDDGITVFAYASDIRFSLTVGDTISVDGNFHKYALYGGQWHDMFIATHRIERLE